MRATKRTESIIKSYMKDKTIANVKVWNEGSDIEIIFTDGSKVKLTASGRDVDTIGVVYEGN